MSNRRPSIFQIGRVSDDGTTVTVGGWGIGLCARRCRCHMHPVHGQLVIHEDQAAGQLGLMHFRAGCDCCEHWTATELASVLRDLRVAAALATT